MVSMPDWTDDKYAPFKIIVEAYINSLNNRAPHSLSVNITGDEFNKMHC